MQMDIKDCFGLQGQYREDREGNLVEEENVNLDDCLQCELFERCFQVTVLDCLDQIRRELVFRSRQERKG